jgi:molecular chaperone HscC
MIIGIDLGTTNSLVAVWQDGGAHLIPNGLGELLTPSCVSLDSDGTVLVGRAARERLQTHPERTAAVFKRYMGSDKVFMLNKRAFRAEELSALVLKSLKADAEAYLGYPVTEAVITVPAYFSDAQRKATRTAGQLAGLRVDRLLNEPTAAALAYGMHLKDPETKFMVFDLGGGTFDVSILEIFEGVMEVRSTAGDNHLGGEDFVHCLIDLFFQEHNLPAKLKNDAKFMQRLIGQAEAAKKTLSSLPTAEIEIFYGKQQYVTEITEAGLEEACGQLLKRLRIPIERVLRDAGFRSNDLDSIVLAGGATRMPIVRRLATVMFGRFPASDINPDEVVALGAAVQAGLKMKDAALSEVVMTDVTPYSLGVEVAVNVGVNAVSNGHFDPVIERNSPIPISRVKRYFPVRDHQTHINLQIYQGEARLVSDNIHLGQIEVSLPQARSRDECGVDVRFTYDVNGIIQVEATVLKTQLTMALIIQENPGLLSDDEIAQRIEALAELKIHPRDRLEIRTLIARSDRLYEQLRGEQREWLGAQIGAFERVLETQDKRIIEPALTEFCRMLDYLEADSFINIGADDPLP